MASVIKTAVVTGGTNNHPTSVADVNAFATDFAQPGVVGTIVLNSGSGGAGSFAVNAQGTPAMFIDVTGGAAYITATPAGQTSQLLRASMAATYTSYAISSNTSGSTRYDWIYLQIDPTKANNPASDASDVTALYTSRSSSSTADDGSPPTYGLLLAVVTVPNGASSIANSAISDKRVGTALSTTSTTTYFFDFIESGCVWSGDSYSSTLNASMTSGFIWISGKRLAVDGVSARTFSASRDTYIDLSDNGDGTAAFTYTAVTNNAASPALAAGAIRVGIIVTGSSSIAAAGSVNQGQESAVLPIASSIPYTVTDSLGNLICPRDASRKLLGYRQITGTFSTGAGGSVQVTGLTAPVIIPTGRKVKITFFTQYVVNDTAQRVTNVTIWDGTVGSGTQLGGTSALTATSTGNQTIPASAEAINTPTSSTKTYNIGLQATGGGGNSSIFAASTSPAFIKVELM